MHLRKSERQPFTGIDRLRQGSSSATVSFECRVDWSPSGDANVGSGICSASRVEYIDSGDDRPDSVESGCGAVALGTAYLFPSLSFDGA